MARCEGRLKPLPRLFTEEDRSKRPSAFSILRALVEEFRGEENSRLGLVGAFGYDLLFQFEPIEKKHARDGHKDLHLYLCDDIWFMDRKKEQIERFQYDFTLGEATTRGLKARWRQRRGPAQDGTRPRLKSDHKPGSLYGGRRAASAKACSRGDYYEVVLRQTFHTPYSGKGFRVIRARAAAPAPALTNSCFSSATNNSSPPRPRCSSASRAAAWKPVPSPEPRSAAEIRCAMPISIRSC